MEEFGTLNQETPGMLETELNGHPGGSLEDRNTGRSVDSGGIAHDDLEGNKDSGTILGPFSYCCFK